MYLDEPELLRNNINYPIFARDNLNLKEIFNVTLKPNDVPLEKVCKKAPNSVRETATFIVNQRKCKLRHPYDLEADDTLGAMTKKEAVRFYRVSRNEFDELKISNEAVVRKLGGKVIEASINERDGAKWVKHVVGTVALYAVVRRRAVNKSIRENHDDKFVRIIYIHRIKQSSLALQY